MAVTDRAVQLLKQIVEAFDKGSVEMSSEEVGAGADVAPHPWHEEWLHYAREEVQLRSK